MSNLSWRRDILPHARDIVRSYDTGVTLRQLFYRLVADGTLPNLQTKYRQLSATTAEARRAAWFPSLLDRTSDIEQWGTFAGPSDAMDYVVNSYRRDRTAGQDWSIYLGVEKAGLSAQLDHWFGNPLGLPILALGGYASQSLVDKIRRDIRSQDRPSVLIYAGDHDPTGEDIDRDLIERVGYFAKWIRVALDEGQISEYNLPFNPDGEVEAKLRRDPRGEKFIDRHGYLEQYEVDALDPDVLRTLYQTAIDGVWDDDAYDEAITQEEADRETLTALQAQIGEQP